MSIRKRQVEGRHHTYPRGLPRHLPLRLAHLAPAPVGVRVRRLVHAVQLHGENGQLRVPEGFPPGGERPPEPLRITGGVGIGGGIALPLVPHDTPDLPPGLLHAPHHVVEQVRCPGLVRVPPAERGAAQRGLHQTDRVRERPFEGARELQVGGVPGVGGLPVHGVPGIRRFVHRVRGQGPLLAVPEQVHSQLGRVLVRAAAVSGRVALPGDHPQIARSQEVPHVAPGRPFPGRVLRGPQPRLQPVQPTRGYVLQHRFPGAVLFRRYWPASPDRRQPPPRYPPAPGAPPPVRWSRTSTSPAARSSPSLARPAAGSASPPAPARLWHRSALPFSSFPQDSYIETGPAGRRSPTRRAAP